MAKKLKDTNFLFSSSKIKALEHTFIKRAALLQLCDAGTAADGMKLLAELGYAAADAADAEQLFEQKQLDIYAEALSFVPVKELVNFFKIKYDYHNLKTIIKGEVAGEPYDYLLMNCGRIEPQVLKSSILEDKYSRLGEPFATTAKAARELLIQTSDAQQSDMFCDKAQFAEMATEAAKVDLPYLEGYYKLLVDAANLRTAVRVTRLGGSVSGYAKYFLAGGSVSVGTMPATITAENITRIFSSLALTEAAEAGAEALGGEVRLALVDKACENCVMKYLQKGRTMAFGPECVVSYLAAKEAELVALRTLFAGLRAGRTAEQLAERLGDTYA